MKVHQQVRFSTCEPIVYIVPSHCESRCGIHWIQEAADRHRFKLRIEMFEKLFVKIKQIKSIT